MEWSESRLMYVIGIHWNLNFAKIFFTVCGICSECFTKLIYYFIGKQIFSQAKSSPKMVLPMAEINLNN